MLRKVYGHKGSVAKKKNSDHESQGGDKPPGID
jgi:hypothetical protein